VDTSEAINETYIRGLVNYHLDTNRREICPICRNIEVIFCNMQQVQSRPVTDLSRSLLDFNNPVPVWNTTWNGTITFGFEYPPDTTMSMFKDWMYNILKVRANIRLSSFNDNWTNRSNTTQNYNIMVLNVPTIPETEAATSGNMRLTPYNICIVLVFIILLHINTTGYMSDV
jgi:hypothetical protein